MTSAIPVQCYYLTNLSSQLHPCVHACVKIWPSCVHSPTSPVGFNNVSAVQSGANGTEISTSNLPREVNILAPKVSHVGRTYSSFKQQPNQRQKNLPNQRQKNLSRAMFNMMNVLLQDRNYNHVLSSNQKTENSTTWKIDFSQKVLFKPVLKNTAAEITLPPTSTLRFHLVYTKASCKKGIQMNYNPLVPSKQR